VLVQPYRRPGIVIPPDRPLRIRDLMTVQRTTSNAIEYVREVGYANVKTTVATATTAAASTIEVANAEGFYPGQAILIDGTVVKTILSINYVTNVLTLTATVGAIYAVGVMVTSRSGYDAGTIAATPETLIKPEMYVAYDLQTEAVKTIAHWIPASRQIMADAGALAGRINDRLVYGLKFSEEHHILYGDGSSRQLHGILTDPARQTYSWSAGVTGDTQVDAIRRATTKAALAYYPVDGLVVHPNDWEDIELLKGSDKRYLWATVPDGTGAMRIWGIPVVVTTAIKEGEFALGAWGLGATLWDREDATVRVAEQHEDFFIRNMVLVLGEERLVQTVERPESFVHGLFNNAPA
jgi:HK97 family phage major capsid protein